MITIEQVQGIARFSPCVRRKYGALITDYAGWAIASGYNERVGTCCNGSCVRDTLGMAHGENTDAGGEIHAEQAALVRNRYFDKGNKIFIAGLDRDGNGFNGFENRPCYSCARMIKYAQFERVFLPFDGQWESISIDDIMENWEATWK